MNLSLRLRTGLVLAGLVIVTPLLVSAPAGATADTVTFTGTPLTGKLLTCPSTPSQTELTVTAGTVVNFVNRTGRTATLWAGDAEKSLPDQSLVPVTFGGGPASIVVQMLPDCALDLGKHEQMTVKVLAAPHGSFGQTLAASPPESPGSGAAATHPTPSDNDPFAQAPPDGGTKPIIGTAVAQPESHGASGLLTLIATVGVVGVFAAIIRAIAARRSIYPVTT
jgi:hypothetical protein